MDEVGIYNKARNPLAKTLDTFSAHLKSLFYPYLSLTLSKTGTLSALTYPDLLLFIVFFTA